MGSLDSEAGAVEVSEHGYRLRVLPAQGGRVIHLSGPSGVNWLAESGYPWPASKPGLWAEGDTRGWDECFPNIAPEVVGTRTLSDHGDLWNSSWTADPKREGTLQARSVSVPLTFARAIDVGESIAVHYAVTSSSGGALDVCWAMHLLLAVELEQVQLPDAALVRFEGIIGVDRAVPDGWIDWGSARSLLPLDKRDGWGCKLYVAPGQVDRIEIGREDERLTIAPTDCPVAPTFGLWINRGVLPGRPEVRHVGVEAGFGDHDRLTDSVRAGTSLVIPGHGSRAWTVKVAIDADPTS